MQLSTAIVVYASHTVAVYYCHTLSIVTTTCSVLTPCSIDASPTMPSHEDQTKANRIPPAKHPSTHRHVCVNRNQSQIRIKVDPATPASTMSIVITVSSASHVQFVIPIGIPKMSGSGSSVCTTTRSRRCRCRCRTYNYNKIPVSKLCNHHEIWLLRSAQTVAMILLLAKNEQSNTATTAANRRI